MKMPLIAFGIVTIISVASACTPAPKQAKYTVEQYLIDRPLMNKKVEECANNPGELNGDPDCINALAAAERDSHKTLRELDRERRPGAAVDEPASLDER